MLRLDPESLLFSYACQYRGIPGPEHDPLDYPVLWTVGIQTLAADDGTDDIKGGVQVGEASVYLIADVTDIDVFDVLDGISGEFASLGHLLGYERPDLTRAPEPDVLFVSSLRIEPEFRGSRLGHDVLTAILGTVGRSAGAVVLEPVPTDGGPEEGTVEYAVACQALRQYWDDYGFDPAGEKYLVLDELALEVLRK